jgi:C4-dicarboxylate-specific signal transduction histidine kinase
VAERSRAATGRNAVVETGLCPAPASAPSVADSRADRNGPAAADAPPVPAGAARAPAAEHGRLLERIAELEARVRQRDEQRRAMLHILQDSHRSNLRLERARRAMIHIMGDLHEMTTKMARREQDLRDKQEQLVQAGKLATLGELTAGVAHELNNPLNNIGLFIGNVVDQIRLGGGGSKLDLDLIAKELDRATAQVRKATEIISHLRTFGRVAPISREPVSINEVIMHALSLMREQLRLRDIDVTLDLCADSPVVAASPIQLEQVFINLLTNARDALTEVPASGRRIDIRGAARPGWADVLVRDTGRGIPPGLEQRIFDPFFTTKGVGKGTGLGLAITYGILKDHGGSIALVKQAERGAAFLVQLPQLREALPEPVLG